MQTCNHLVKDSHGTHQCGRQALGYIDMIDEGGSWRLTYCGSHAAAMYLAAKRSERTGAAAITARRTYSALPASGIESV